MLKIIGLSVAGIVAILAIIAMVMLFMRGFSSMVTVISVEEVAPGVSCAKMITNDGAAISCWKE